MSDAATATTEHSKCVNRVMNYPAVSSIFSNVQNYYKSAKESSKLLNYLESSVTGSYNWIAPKVVEPVVNSETFQKYSKPLLASVDEFGCRQLDTIEKYKESIDKRVTSIKQTTQNLAETGTEKIVVPVDHYLKESKLALPLNKLLDVTENVVNSYILSPELKETKEEEDKALADYEKYNGPVFRAGKISLKLQRQAFSKLKNLSLRTPERLKSMVHTVDLIQYAANVLDYGVKTTNQILETSVTKGKQISTLVEINVPAVQRVKVVVHDTAVALSVVASTLSQQAAPFAQIPAKLWNVALELEERELRRFVVIAQKSAATLREISSSISDYIARNEVAPPQVVKSASAKISQIIDTLHNFYQTALQKGEEKMKESQRAKDQQNEQK